MKARFITLLAAAGLLASCAKEALTEKPEITTGKTVFTVGLPQEGKIVMGESVNNSRPLYWSNGDQININGCASDALENLPANPTTAEFTFDQVLTTPYNVLYPAAIYTDATQVTLPASQTYKNDGFADGMFPMAGYSADGSSTTMSPLCAVVKVQVLRASTSPDEDDLASVTFKGRNNEQVSGLFNINFEAPELTGASDDAASRAVKVVKRIATSTSEAAVYYVVVPAGTYSNGFDVTVKDQNGHFMTKSKTASIDLVPGKLYGMAEFEFVPTGTEIGIEINSADDLIQFATDYNNKVYESLGDEPLVATLTSDIFFDTETSAQFNATGGIGMKIGQYGGATEDYYFNGVVYGDNHSISGLIATVPVFAAIGDNGSVSDLTIDENCSFTFTHPNTVELDAGALVGYNKGVVSNVAVDADVTIAAGEIAQVTALGGIAGRITIGTVDNCTYSGNISVPDEFIVDAKKTYVGGLVGSITNAAGKVQNSDFEGTIDFAGIVASTSTSDPFLRLGGIVGTVNAGTVSDCEAKGTNTKAIEMDNGTTYAATIQNHSRKAYHLVQGGIAGYNAGAISNCTNGASTKNFVLANATKGGTSNDKNSRYYDVAGIVGLNAAGATVSDCTNNGLIESRSTPRIQKIGGIVGYNLGTVSSSSNSATGDIVIASATGQSPYSLRVGEVGGAIGNNSGTISNIQNAGDITLSRTENADGVEMKFGGVIGISTKAIDGGTSKEISNTGNISIGYNPATVTTDGLRIGGVVGSAQASVQNVSNTGNVTYTLSAANIMSKLYMGGIAGEVRNTTNVTVSDCENSGEVYFNVNAKAAAHTGDYLGGIIGYVTGEESTITVSDCENSGPVHINCNITTACTDLIAAGVVGKMNESGAITDCDNTGGEVNIAFSDAAHTENFAGGVLGKTVDSNLAISGCTNSGYIHGGNAKKRNGTTMYVGGIVAYLDGESSISECVNSGNVYNDQFVNSSSTTNAFTGGIAAFVVGVDGSPITISNCEHNTANLASRRGYQGGIVGYANYVSISDSDNNSSFLGGSVYYSGGIAGWVQNGSITNCDFTGASIYSSQIQANGGGGIAAKLESTEVDGCQSSVTDIYHTNSNGVKDADVAGGAIVGISESGNTIQNCHYKPTINGAASNIAGTGKFTDGGGNVADL